MFWRDVIPDFTVFNALCDDIRYNLGIISDHSVGFAFKVPGVASDLQEEYLCRNAVFIIIVDLTPYELSQLVQGSLDTPDIRENLSIEIFQIICQHLVQQSPFVFKVSINEGLVHTGFPGDFSRGNGIEVLMGQK